MSFLTAHWKKLIMVNYEVNPEVLRPYIPAGTELDLYEDKCYVSLVGFLFDETRLLGIPVPFHKKFEEVNLRFYVKRFEAGEWKRGVVFIKEVVPLYMVCAIANLVYGEHYTYAPMSHSFKRNNENIEITYIWNTFSIKATVSNEVKALEDGSIEEFIAEHYWGYSRISVQKTGEYEVVHPRWKMHELKHYEVNCEFNVLYGKEFAELTHKKPASVFVAEGSEVEVKKRRMII